MANALFTIVMRMEIEPHGLLGLAAPLLRGRMQTLFERNLANIKARLERAERGSPSTSLKRRAAMQTMKEAASEFLAKKRVAVTGVSRKPQGHGSNVVYQRLRQRGYQVFAVNPNTDNVEGDPCYHDLQSIPGGVDWVVIGTRPETAEATMRECADLGITHVWMHRSFGAGSVSEAAAEYGRQHGIKVIDGGCPCMFDPTADAGHKAMRFVFTLTGNVPKRV
jgi:predicted CoA-binding protein